MINIDKHCGLIKYNKDNSTQELQYNFISSVLHILVHVEKKYAKYKPEPIQIKIRKWTDNAIASNKQHLATRDWSNLERDPVNFAYNYPF